MATIMRVPCLLVLMWICIAMLSWITIDVDAMRKPLLYVFGDSYADTGNHDPNEEAISGGNPWKPPYGMTWPGYPTGRYSNGRVLTDFFASHLGIKVPLPYRYVISKNLTKEIPCGINFAYGGSGIFPTYGPSFPTIKEQIGQFKTLMENGLIQNVSTTKNISYVEPFALLVIAGNDYIAYLLSLSQYQDINDLIPNVVKGTGNSLEELYTIGFRRFVVTKIEPFGCMPLFTIKTNNLTICNETLNSWASLHNQLLVEELATLQNKHHDAKYTMLDLESIFLQITQGGSKYIGVALEACCEGINGAFCGAVDSNGKPLYNLCSSPENYFFWDDAHPSEMGWKVISKLLFKK